MLQSLGAIELEPIPRSQKLSSHLSKPSIAEQAASKSQDESHINASPEAEASEEAKGVLKKGRSIIVVAILTLVLVLNSVSTGFLTVGIPRMAADLNLEDSLLLWPQSVYGLTSGSCLLLAGSIADVVGSRIVNLVGTFLLACFMIACGLPRTGIELIMFRAMQGISVALIMPTGMSIVSTAISSGTRRNIAFSCLGAGQCIGFAVGLVLSGVFLDTVGWRAGWYMSGAITMVLFFIGVWALPADRRSRTPVVHRLKKEVDWVGAALASGCLAMLSYVLAMMTSDIAYIRQGTNVALLSLSLALVPAFIFWVGRQERLGKPALIPNSIWNKEFTSICLMILLSFAVMQTMELFVSLFFQQVQHISALQTSLRILPAAAMGIILEATMGLFVHKFSVMYLVVISSLLSAGSPLLMAVINSKWPYWYDAFFAQLLMYFSIDVLFTVGILIISNVFPDRTQALAGAVFNVMCQFGLSLGLAVMGVISSSVTQHSKYADKGSPEALEEGYRASFWASLACMLLLCCIGIFGLRKVGKVGVKRD